MANVPNARRYRTTGTRKTAASAASSGGQGYGDSASRDAGHGSANFDSPKLGPFGLLIVLLVFVLLAIKFPVLTLTAFGIAMAARWLLGKN